MNELTEPQKAYIAGIIDGEGCIYVRHNRPKKDGWSPYYGLVCIVASTDMVLLEWLQKTIRLGRIYQRSSNSNQMPGWNYVLCANQASYLLEAIYPYLIVKTEQALLGIELQHLEKSRGKRISYDSDIAKRRIAISEQIKALKRVNKKSNP